MSTKKPRGRSNLARAASNTSSAPVQNFPPLLLLLVVGGSGLLSNTVCPGSPRVSTSKKMSIRSATFAHRSCKTDQMADWQTHRLAYHATGLSVARPVARSLAHGGTMALIRGYLPGGQCTMPFFHNLEKLWQGHNNRLEGQGTPVPPTLDDGIVGCNMRHFARCALD